MSASPLVGVSPVPEKVTEVDILSMWCSHRTGSLSCQMTVVRVQRPSRNFQNCVIPLTFQSHPAKTVHLKKKKKVSVENGHH